MKRNVKCYKKKPRILIANKTKADLMKRTEKEQTNIWNKDKPNGNSAKVTNRENENITLRVKQTKVRVWEHPYL